MIVLYTWFKRIHFGKWKDRKDWQAHLEKVCRRWVFHMPVIPVTDNGRNLLPIRHKNENVQSWQYAGLLFGLDESFSEQFLGAFPDSLKSPTVDKALLAYVLFKKNQLSKEGLLDFARQLNADSGHTVPYQRALPDIRYVDAIGMLVPFLAACGMQDAAIAQLKEYDVALLNGVIPPHAYDIKRGLPLGVYDWSRGLGWYILGITESSQLDGCSEKIVRLAEEMMNFRLPNGGLGSMFFSPTRIESSGTAMLGILFVKAFDITGRKEYLDAAVKSEQALMHITRRDGVLDYGQGDTVGIGMYSRRFDILPFAQGMALRLSKELDLRLKL